MASFFPAHKQQLARDYILPGRPIVQIHTKLAECMRNVVILRQKPTDQRTLGLDENNLYFCKTILWSGAMGWDFTVSARARVATLAHIVRTTFFGKRMEPTYLVSCKRLIFPLFVDSFIRHLPSKADNKAILLIILIVDETTLLFKQSTISFSSTVYSWNKKKAFTIVSTLDRWCLDPRMERHNIYSRLALDIRKPRSLIFRKLDVAQHVTGRRRGERSTRNLEKSRKRHHSHNKTYHF
jgi:hypothetical protein